MAADAATAAAQPTSHRWVRGWVERFRLDLLACEPWVDAQAESAARTLERAWRLNAGYRFQRQLLLARVAAHGAPALGEALEPGVRAQLAWAIASAHRAKRGRRPSECPRCWGASLGAQAAHATGRHPQS